MSSCAAGHLGWVLEGREDLAGNVAFEATDDLGLAQSLSGAAAYVCLGPAIVTKPDHHDTIESRIGLAVAATVQPMPAGLAGGSRFRTHPAQGGEGSLGVEAFRVAASGDQGCRRLSGPMPKTLTKAGAGLLVSRSSSASKFWTSLLS